MEVFPGEYRKLEMTKSEKLFVKYTERSKKDFGCCIIHINPALQQGESIDAVIIDDGVLFFRFYEDIKDSTILFQILPILYTSTEKSSKIIENKLTSNRVLLGKDDKLLFPTIYLMVFPDISREEIINKGISKDILNQCIFREDLASLKEDFDSVCSQLLKHSFFDISKDKISIDNNSFNSILQRIAPEYTTVRLITNQTDYTVYAPGVSDEMLVITPDDIAVRAYRLDVEQVNIVNKMEKGDQLILACAGSGKSVLLIAKCFKAARMNPDKQFLITCYNTNLRNLYIWYIERAGMKERNVDCLTFDSLCKKLLKNASLPVPSYGDHIHDERRAAAIRAMNAGKIHNKYYGVFIDEVQIFHREWYKLCYNLLENKDSKEHIFVICGDKTQNVEKLKRHGKAPWNAGEGYPNFRGGNKSIRIEKNYRNCIEVNSYINRYAEYAKRLIGSYVGQQVDDPDLFLRGKAYKHGFGVKLAIGNNYAKDESLCVIKSIREIHDHLNIPYDEIAVILVRRQYRPKYYYIAEQLIEDLYTAGIPYNDMANIEETNQGYYGDEGVSIVSIQTSLGLDYRAVIICGLMPFGLYEGVKLPKKGKLTEDKEEELRRNIRLLYVACSRAKDVLYLQLPDDGTYSIYSKLLIDAYKDPEGLGNE